MRLFAEVDLSIYLQTQKLGALKNEVHNEDKNKLLNVNETEYIAYLINKYQIDPLVFHWEDISVSGSEIYIPADRFPIDFYVVRGESYPKQVITYHIPFSGSAELLRYAPSTRLLWSFEVEMSNNNISFDIVNWRDDSNSIKREAEHIISNIKQQSDYLNADIRKYNSSLEHTILGLVQSRKAEHLKQANLLANLGVPFKKTEDVPSTFVIPIVKKKALIKPTAPNVPFFPEHSLDKSVYRDILKICYDTGVEMERHPSIYNQKNEETLRDHFIMVLAPHFQSVTGETFNKRGKTDILIRHEKVNVFVAECKFWRGIKTYHKTIDQILSYLTWRDSKAAILCFIKNTSLSPILEQIEVETANHPCFIKYKGKGMDGWFNFEFHLKDDDTRSIQLAVLCFHFAS